MRVQVKAYGGLDLYMPGQKEELQVEVEEGATLGALVEKLGIPNSEIWLMSLNRDLAKADQVLKDGDLVMLFAPVAGG